jgi:hypothetical protein
MTRRSLVLVGIVKIMNLIDWIDKKLDITKIKKN